MQLSLLLLVLVPALIAIWGLFDGRRIFEYPVGVSLLFIAWIIPQAIYIENSGFSQRYDGHIAWVYMVACLVFLTAGFYVGKNRRRGARQRSPLSLEAYDLNALAYGTFALIGFGALCMFLMMREAATQNLGNRWTGISTAYALGSQTVFYGFALAFLLYGRTKNKLFLVAMAACFFIFLPAITIGVKRNVIFEVVFILGAGWFFMYRRAPPRIVVISVLLLGTVLVHQVGAVRQFIQDGRGSVVDAVNEGVLFERFEYFNLQKAREIEQAVFDIYVTHETLELEGGVEYWNRVVHQYVPAFLLGQEFKDSLKAQSNVASERIGLDRIEWAGATRTGFSDTFRSFWILGVGVFFLIGYGFGWTYQVALAGSIWGQFYYLILLNDGLVAITESTARLLAALPFLILITYMVRRQSRRRRAVSIRTRTRTRAASKVPWAMNER